MERKVIVIVGPTCSGKTALSLSLAQKINAEIVSADSRQFFKYLNIGTAKPDCEELNLTKHHFIDSLELEQYYNVSLFEIDALKVIDDIFSRQQIPIMVGGSGLYIRAVVDGIFDNVETPSEIREKIMELREKRGDQYIYDELAKIDHESAKMLLPQNWKRVVRALEVFHSTGKPIWYWQQKHERIIDIEFKQYGLNWDREILYRNIEVRVDQMIEQGLVEEIKKILDLGYSKDLNSLNTVGYKEIISYLDNEISLERAIELIKRNTRRYAKRQLTWFRKDERIKWFDVSCNEDILKISEKIIALE